MSWGNCSALYSEIPFQSVWNSQNMVGSMFLIHIRVKKILYDQLNIGNMTTLLPINDDVGNGGTHRGK